MSGKNRCRERGRERGRETARRAATWQLCQDEPDWAARWGTHQSTSSELNKEGQCECIAGGRQQTPGHFISQTRVDVAAAAVVVVNAFVCLPWSRAELFPFGNSLLHLTTNSIENLSRHSTCNGQRQRRGREGERGPLEERRKFKNKFAAMQQQSQRELGERAGRLPSKAKLFAKKTSIQFV